MKTYWLTLYGEDYRRHKMYEDVIEWDDPIQVGQYILGLDKDERSKILFELAEKLENLPYGELKLFDFCLVVKVKHEEA